MLKFNPITGQMDLVPDIEKLVYHVFLTQSGTDAPTAAVLKDTVTGIVLTRSATGTTLFTKVGAFTVGKSVPKKVVQYFDNDGNRLVLTPVSADVYKLETYAAADTETLADDILIDQELYLEIYA